MGWVRGSHVVHIAWVGHLLQVEARAGVGAAEHTHGCPLHQVLQVHEAAPHIAQVRQGVRRRARVPKPGPGAWWSVLERS